MHKHRCPLVGAQVVGWLLSMAVCCSALLSYAAVSPSIMVRGSGNMRLWQTAFRPDEPLTWRWGDSDEASVVVSNVLTKAVSQQTVVRDGSEPEGHISLPLPADPAVECLFDVTVTLSADDEVVADKFARVAVLPSCREGGSCCLPDPNSRAWSRIEEPHLAGYDAAWFGATSATATLETIPASGQQGSAFEFSSNAGYFPVNVRGLFGSSLGGTLTLSFDGMPLAAEALLAGKVSGTIIVVR